MPYPWRFHRNHRLRDDVLLSTCSLRNKEAIAADTASLYEAHPATYLGTSGLGAFRLRCAPRLCSSCCCVSSSYCLILLLLLIKGPVFRRNADTTDSSTLESFIDVRRRPRLVLRVPTVLMPCSSWDTCATCYDHHAAADPSPPVPAPSTALQRIHIVFTSRQVPQDHKDEWKNTARTTAAAVAVARTRVVRFVRVLEADPHTPRAG